MALSGETSFVEKLANSDAVKTLLEERRIAELFKRAGWDARNGRHYRDVVTGKDREVDVHARKIISPLESMQPLLRIEVFVEVKSIPSYSIVFSCDDIDPYSLDVGDYIFKINDFQNWPHLKGRLDQIYNPLEVSDVFNRLEDLRTTDVMFGYRPKIKKEKINAVSFRETNIDKVKDTDNSVLWRAGESLSSAHRSFKETILNWHTEWIFPEFVSYLGNQSDEDHEPIEQRDTLVSHVAVWDIFHPVIFLGAKMFLLVGTTLKPLSVARLWISRVRGESRWYDVVSSEHAEKYIKALSAHYDREELRFKKVCAKYSDGS